MNNNAKEIVIIFRKKYYKDEEFYVPFKVVRGNYDDNDAVFIDSYGNLYHHILDLYDGNCYALRENVDKLIRESSNITYIDLKEQYLNEAKSYDYYIEYNINGVLKISMKNKITNEIKYLKDKDTEEIEQCYISPDYNEDDDIDIDSFVEKAEEKIKSQQKISTPISTPKTDILNPIQINIGEMFQELTKNIVGQDEAIKKILSTIWFNYNNKNIKKAQNIFINGPTGVGKTEVFRLISKMIGVPCIIEDLNDFTMEGYMGRSVKDIISDIISKANNDVEKASQSIVVLDEIDKIATVSASENVSTTGVQDALLKIIEEGDYTVKIGNEKKHINTSKITFVALGAFSNIENTKAPVIGFENDLSKLNYANIGLNDLQKYGMKMELLGRFSSLVQMKELTIEDLYNISKYSNLSPLLERNEFYGQYNIDLLYNDRFLLSVAEAASKLKTGARGIVTILNDIFTEIDMEISANAHIYKTLEIYDEIFRNNQTYGSSYRLIRR